MHTTKYNITTFYDGVFNELQELLCYALRELGYTVFTSSRTIYTDAINIVFAAHTLGEKAKELPNNVIIFNLEQLNLNDNVPAIVQWTKLYAELGKRFEIWDYNGKNLAFWQSIGVQAKLFEFGYQKELNRIYRPSQAEPVLQDIDVLSYGSINDRRRHILNGLIERGLKVKHLFGVYGEERDKWIARSKLVINIHQFSQSIFEVVRCSYLMNNGVPIVSEINPTTTIDPRFLNSIAAVPYDQLIDKCVELVNDNLARQTLGYQALSNFSQKPQFELLKPLL
ncbi:hypothetical protein [Conservatibacter flavescens]|uniref:Glycosyltransferase family 1 protein n=1 Tax=Conservatibacter flavescens TaxID=28161 RepID=A0A2M8S3A5_9PAST|nr:hypothetical protein [Conservatibacter flavescens]PJG85625.1 hypothetical protein CVP05_05545 [Conservatibacter flavescens]